MSSNKVSNSFENLTHVTSITNENNAPQIPVNAAASVNTAALRMLADLSTLQEKFNFNSRLADALGEI